VSGQGDSGGGDKTHDPSAKRLDDSRKKGDIVRSTDISAAAAFFGLAFSFTAFGPNAVRSVGSTLAQFLTRPEMFESRASGGDAVMGSVAKDIATAVAPIFLAPMVIVALVLVAQQSFVFVASKIQPKLSRVSPLSMAKNKFGPTGLFEFFKSFVKMVVVALVVAWFFSRRFDLLIGSVQSNARQVVGVIGDNVVQFIWLTVATAIPISAIDYAWQAYDHRRKLMMSRQELVDENKESDGDPHLKQSRRQRGMDIAMQRMMADVPGADVIVVNPQHFAVALKWDRGHETAPICVAKGVDEIAARIRAAATAAGVPIHRDPPTARAIFSTVDVGREINPEHYLAVAAAIRYAEKLRKFAVAPNAVAPNAVAPNAVAPNAVAPNNANH